MRVPLLSRPRVIGSALSVIWRLVLLATGVAAGSDAAARSNSTARSSATLVDLDSHRLKGIVCRWLIH